MRWLVLSFAAAVMAGCPGATGAGSGSGYGPCVEAYAKCKTPAGPLGVCEPIAACDAGSGPCLRCQGQH